MAVQGFYNRVNTHIVVKPVRLSCSSMLLPGHVLKPGDLRIFHMRSLFNRRLIGIDGTPWVINQLGGLKVTPIEKKTKKESDVKTEQVIQEEESVIEPTQSVIKKRPKIVKPWEDGDS